MSHLFGGPVRIDGMNTTAGTSAVEDMDIVRRALQRLKTGEAGVLRFYRPVPTAAFAPRDITSEHYRAAAGCMRSLGFAPVERLAGGHLAVYDEHALVIGNVVTMALLLGVPLAVLVVRSVSVGDSWGLVRASNTQPVLVLRFEAPTAARLNRWRKAGA